jgi:hypothetical protein
LDFVEKWLISLINSFPRNCWSLINRLHKPPGSCARFDFDEKNQKRRNQTYRILNQSNISTNSE